jgi:hypothetical protein
MSPAVARSSLHKRKGMPPLVIVLSTLYSPGIQPREADTLIKEESQFGTSYSERCASDPWPRTSTLKEEGM